MNKPTQRISDVIIVLENQLETYRINRGVAENEHDKAEVARYDMKMKDLTEALGVLKNPVPPAATVAPTETTIQVPKGAKNMKVKVNDLVYLVVASFDDEHEIFHFWRKDGQYDGWDGKACNDKCGDVEKKST
jgi:hypothetical protein